MLYGGELLSIEAMLKVILLIIFTTAASSFMMYYIVSWFKSINAFTTASTIVGTLIGFLTGIYIPIGSLPEAVQMVIKIFPPSHAAVLFRSVMMEQAEKITFADAPIAVLEEFQVNLGVVFKFGDTILSLMLVFFISLFS